MGFPIDTSCWAFSRVATGPHGPAAVKSSGFHRLSLFADGTGIVRNDVSMTTEAGWRPTILFVDDDPLVLRSLARLFRVEVEWDLVFELGGASALTRLGERRFDVVVSDYKMPHITGDLVLASAATLQPHTLRLLLTASDVRADEAHAHGVVDKPFDPSGLRTLLRAWLERVRAPKASAAM